MTVTLRTEAPGTGMLITCDQPGCLTGILFPPLLSAEMVRDVAAIRYLWEVSDQANQDRCPDCVLLYGSGDQGALTGLMNAEST